MSVRTSITLAALAGAALGLGLLGFATAAGAHTPHDNWQPISVTVQASGQSEWHNAHFSFNLSGNYYFDFPAARLSAGPHVEIEAPYPYPPVSYQANVATLQVKLKLVKYSFPIVNIKVLWQRVGPWVSPCDNSDHKWAVGVEKSSYEMKYVFQNQVPVGDVSLYLSCYDGGHFDAQKQWVPDSHNVFVTVRFVFEPEAVELEWYQWKQAATPSANVQKMFGPTGGAWSNFPMDLPVKPGYFNEEGGYAVRARATVPNANWSALRSFCIGDPAKCYKDPDPPKFSAKIPLELQAIVIKKSGPDLVVAKFWVETVQPGQQMPEGQTAQKPHWYFVWRVENIGDKHSGAATLKIDCQAQGGSPPCPAGVAKSYYVGQFWPKPEDPAEAKAKEYTWAQLVSTMGVAAPDVPVKWQLTATVDPDNKVAEKDKLNNQLVSDFPSQIDLPKFAGQVAMASSVKGGKGSALQRQAADEAARDLDTLTKRLTPLQQDREGQLLLREVHALQRELAASPDPKEADRLLRDAQRLTRELDRLEASLLREQQRAAPGSPAPAKPEAPAPGSQPDQPSGPPQVAAIPRPAAPARDPVAEEAAKELEALAKRLTALGGNPEAQRFLREVQLLQRQLGSDPSQAPALLRDAKRLTGEVNRLEASLQKPTTPLRIVPRPGPVN